MVTIAAEGLSISLGRRRVLDAVDMALAGGTLVGIIGPNGAGKSTLARALLGLVPAVAGRALIDGADVARLRRSAIARRVGYLPQGQEVHWPISVARLAALGRLPHLGPFATIGGEDRAAMDRAMALADVAHLADRSVADLSGGERARALLARAVAAEAPALIADEPLAALDPGHQIGLMRLFRQRADAGALIVTVLHDLTMAARYCDRLLLLDRGRLIADGAPAAVLTATRLAETYGVRAWTGDVEGAPLIVPFDKAGGG